MLIWAASLLAGWGQDPPSITVNDPNDMLTGVSTDRPVAGVIRSGDQTIYIYRDEVASEAAPGVVGWFTQLYQRVSKPFGGPGEKPATTAPPAAAGTNVVATPTPHTPPGTNRAERADSLNIPPAAVTIVRPPTPTPAPAGMEDTPPPVVAPPRGGLLQSLFSVYGIVAQVVGLVLVVGVFSFIFGSRRNDPVQRIQTLRRTSPLPPATTGSSRLTALLNQERTSPAPRPAFAPHAENPLGIFSAAAPPAPAPAPAAPAAAPVAAATPAPNRESIRESMTDLTGTIQRTALGELIQFLNAGKETGILAVKDEHKQPLGLVYMAKGEIVDATCGAQRGLDAVYAVLRRTKGYYTFKRREQIEQERTVTQGTIGILLEAYRIIDEEKG